MTLFSIYFNTMRLADCGRRSFYVKLTLAGRCAWVQWWPRNPRALSCGLRKGD